MKKGRLLYIDVIKTISIVLVILIHVSSSVIYSVKVDSSNFAIYNFFDSISRSCVPLFVMASGAYFLNNKNKLDLKKLFKKYIFNIIIALIFSSVVIELLKYLVSPGHISMWKFLVNVMTGDYVLWFFYMILGFYIITPILRQITKSKEITFYLITISFIIGVFIPTINYFLELEFLNKLISQMFFGMFDAYGGFCVLIYYLLGFYLSEFEFEKKYVYLLYVLGILGVILSFSLTEYFSIINGSPNFYFYNYMTLPVFFTSVALFLFFKYLFNDKITKNKMILLISTSTLFIYPIHRMLLVLFSLFDISKILIEYPFIGVPLYTICLLFLSLFISILIRKVSFILQKYPVCRYLLYLIIFILILIV